MKKSKLQFLYDLSINLFISFVLIHIVRAVFLYNTPLASEEAIKLDIHLDRANLIFSSLFFVIAAGCKVYTNIRKLSYLELKVRSFILIPFILIASIFNQNTYYQEISNLEKIYNSNNITRIQEELINFKQRYQQQSYVEFHRIDIINKFEIKIKEYNKEHPANCNYWESPIWPKI